MGWLVRISQVVLSVSVTLALVEIALRIADFPPTETNHQRAFVEYDETRGWKNVPNASGRYTTEEYSGSLQFNSRGIRGPERSYSKSPGTYRIVVLGDSFVEGYSVQEADRVTEVLERLLAAKLSRPVQVIALGTGGYSTDQELLWLESEGLDYQPDLVIVMFYYNDVWYNAQPKYWRGGKPLFVLKGDELALTNVPVPRGDFDQTRSTAFDPNAAGAEFKLSKLADRAVRNTPWLYGWAVRSGIFTLPPDVVLGPANAAPVPSELTVFQKRPTPEISYAWQITSGLLIRMKQDSEKIGAPFIIFNIPPRVSVYASDWAAFQSAYALSDEDWDTHQVSNDFLRMCENDSFRCIDATDQFVESAETQSERGARLYYTSDEHWNPNGHQLAATILAEYLLNNLRISLN